MINLSSTFSQSNFIDKAPFRQIKMQLKVVEQTQGINTKVDDGSLPTR